LSYLAVERAIYTGCQSEYHHLWRVLVGLSKGKNQ